MSKKVDEKEYQLWYDKFFELLPEEMNMSNMFKNKIISRGYALRTLKDFCYAMEWYSLNKDLLPERDYVSFHGDHMEGRTEFDHDDDWYVRFYHRMPPYCAIGHGVNGKTYLSVLDLHKAYPVPSSDEDYSSYDTVYKQNYEESEKV